jgi:hypothetical protein
MLLIGFAGIGVMRALNPQAFYPDQKDHHLGRRIPEPPGAQRVRRNQNITLPSFGSEQTTLRLSRQTKEWCVPSEETAMAVFQPELIELMKRVLEDATAMLPEAKRTSTMKAEIASQILTCAAKGERDPMVLKNSALSAIVDCTHYSHDISPERRAV